MFVNYYELKNENNLPSSASFIDPIDNTIYTVNNKESLLNFMARVEEGRKQKGLPDMLPSDLRLLITISLAETSKPDQLIKYFNRVAMVPKAGQLVSMAKTLIKQQLTKQQVSYLQRQRRASFCRGCKLHRKKGSISNYISNAITRLAGIKDLTQSEEEKQLGTCGMCGCGLQAKVRFGIIGILAGIMPEQLQKILSMYGPKAFSTCWMLREPVENMEGLNLLEMKIKTLPKPYNSFLKAHVMEKQAERSVNGKTLKY